MREMLLGEKPLDSRKLFLYVERQAVNGPASPTLRLLATHNCPADIPIELDQFPIDRQRRFDLGGADAGLDVGEHGGVVGGDGGG